ncbi:MAG TPA: serine hydrolase [Anaerolineales bacterium]|nr:serine hydrolase [Anaerolineales bacterium]
MNYRTQPVRRGSAFLIWVSLGFLIGALILAVLQLVSFSRVRTRFPGGLSIAGVPVGGLDRQEAANRLLAVYSTPVELIYGDASIHLEPSVVGFELQIETMLAAADLERIETPFWVGFWDYLWGRFDQGGEIPLTASFSEARLRAFIETDIASRYDKPATAAQPAVGTVNFIPGIPGTTVNTDEAIVLIENALLSTTDRSVVLPLGRSLPPRLGFENLRFFITQAVDRAGFQGLIGIYLLDLQTADEIHFVYERGSFLGTEPDVAFTASSIIKIPIMVSIFEKVGEEIDSETVKLLEDMIELSGNEPADWVMQRIIDQNLGPLTVTADMHTLGLENTFLAGHFFIGAPLLRAFETPANQRLDVNTGPDVYNQTTTSDMGMLLADIYQCATTGGGALIAIYEGRITQSECQTMLSFLSQNRTGVLIESGAPDGTQVAHKHGWVTNSAGSINSIGDAGIVYTPGGNYVLVIFLHHPVQLIWDPVNGLVTEISQAVFNYYNLEQ